MIPLYDDIKSGRFPWQTILLIAVNSYVFYLELTTPDLPNLIASYALIPVLVDWGNLPSLTPFVTAMFLHGGFLHIGANMLFLWVFGDNVEARLKGFYLPLYIVGGLLGNFFQYLTNTKIPLPILGASGAVAAILGAYLVFFPGHKIKTIFPIFIFFTIISIPAWAMLAYWFFLQFLSGITSLGDVSTQASGGVAYIAHAAGFAVGIGTALFIGLFYNKMKGSRASRLPLV